MGTLLKSELVFEKHDAKSLKYYCIQCLILLTMDVIVQIVIKGNPYEKPQRSGGGMAFSFLSITLMISDC